MGWKRTTAVATSLVLALAACGDDGGDASETGSPPTTEAAVEGTTTTASGEAPAEPTELAVTAADYSYDVGGPPPTVPAGLVRITLTNEGTEEHQATLVRLNDGVTPEQFGDAAASDPSGQAALALVDPYGGPNGAAPGGTSTATQNLVAGDYLMLCFIPSPSDGVPHAAKGMVMPVTVEGDDVEAALPADELAGEIGLTEFSFDVPDGFDGQGTFEITNNGQQDHEVVMYLLSDGATLEDALAALAGEGPPGPPPITPAAGIAPMAGGDTVNAYVELALEPGEYAFLCFLPDTSGSGAPHFTMGMAQQITVS